MTVIEQAKSVFGESLLGTIRKIAALAAEERVRLYLVGGAVRDLLLERPCQDIDFVIEGDGPAFAKWLASEWMDEFPTLPCPASPVVYPRYGTAKLIFPAELAPGVKVLDFATTRAETYPTPGQPPIVKPGKLNDDLERRDFSINAMALFFGPNDKLEIIDEHQGQADIKKKSIRVLHKKSFIDDPARLIRAVRFSTRFGFKFAEATEKLFEQGIEKNYLETIPKPRLLDEFRKALEEQDVTAVLTALKKKGIIKQVHPEIEITEIGLRGIAKETQWEKRIRQLFPKLTQKEFEKILLSFGVGTRELPRFR